MVVFLLSVLIAVIILIVSALIALVRLKGASFSAPKLSFSWPKWCQGKQAGYVGLIMFAILLAFFLAGSLSLPPILMLLLLSVIIILIIVGWGGIPSLVKWLVLGTLIVAWFWTALSFNPEVPSISEKAVEVAPVTQPFLGNDRHTPEGDIVETLSLPPATQLPTTWTFSSSGRLEVQGKYRLQLQGGRYAEFDVKNGDYVESDGYVGNELPSSNVSQYLAPDLSVGLLIIRSQDGGEWVRAQGYFVTPGETYEITLNVNQEYRRYVLYRPGIRVDLYSE
jgi:hypothetical protein